MTNGKGKVDPADSVQQAKEEVRLKKKMDALDISNLSLADFQRIPKKSARYVHPFDGYPLQPAIQLDKDLAVSATYIVALDPKDEPDQDISGKRMTILNLKTKQEEIKDLKTYHSRFIQVGPDSNEDVVFDREMVIDGRPVHYAVVPHHETRAKLLYYYDSRQERYEVDSRYMLLDVGQSARLMRLFQDMMRPALRRERMAAEVAGESDSSEASLLSLPTEA